MENKSVVCGTLLSEFQQERGSLVKALNEREQQTLRLLIHAILGIEIPKDVKVDLTYAVAWDDCEIHEFDLMINDQLAYTTDYDKCMEGARSPLAEQIYRYIKTHPDCCVTLLECAKQLRSIRTTK